MDTGKAIFFGLALIALAIFTSDALRPANAGIMGSGRYMGLRTENAGVINIVDTETGTARACVTLGEGVGCRDWTGK